MDKLVQILMSTYNGEIYLREQIDSILKQKGVKVKLLIRDDGSNDGTVQILREYEKKYKNICVYCGENLGACNSFLDILKYVDTNSEYFAFSDQDDVWNEYKLQRAIQKISNEKNVPTLYCGQYITVNKKMEKIKYKYKKNNHIDDIFGNALIESCCTGGTVVFNVSLLNLLQERIPKNAYMHDWWCYLVAAALGKIIYDEKPYLFYRQHENNVLGVKGNIYTRFLKRIKNYNNLRLYVPKQLEDLKNLYVDKLSDKQMKQINCIINKNKNPILRLSIFTTKGIKRCNKMDDILYKIMFLFWKL